MGYAEEADDPAKRTAATICGVTGRTIRNRLTRAAATLSRFKEDL
jgi:DNA-directed RNA polymerase specialized sigma24 family protein